MCSSARPGTLCSGSRICCRDRGRRDGPGGGADRGGPAAGPGRTADNVTDGARPDWPGRRVAHCGGFKEAAPKARPLVMLFLALDRSAASGGGWHRCGGIWRPGRQAPPVPAGSSASCGALWAGAGSAVSAGFARRAAAPLSGLGRRLVFRARGRGPPPPGPEAG